MNSSLIFWDNLGALCQSQLLPTKSHLINAVASWLGHLLGIKAYLYSAPGLSDHWHSGRTMMQQVQTKITITGNFSSNIDISWKGFCFILTQCSFCGCAGYGLLRQMHNAVGTTAVQSTPYIIHPPAVSAELCKAHYLR